MSDFSLSRPGQNDGSGTPLANFLKVFSGEVLVAFETANVAMSRHETRTIASGHSAQFPVFGKAGAAYHTPGTEASGSSIKNGERVITIDGLLMSDVAIAKIDEAMSHFEVRGPYTNQIGLSLGNQMDRHVLQTILLAARSSATLAEGFGGSEIVDAAAATTGDKLGELIFGAAEEFDAKDVPDWDRVVYVRPSEYYKLVQSKWLNRDFGGEGSTASGMVNRIGNIEIVKTNNLPNAVVATGTTAAGTDDKYAGDFSSTVAAVAQRSAVGTLKLLDLTVTSDGFSARHQSTFVAATYAVGHGVLRPEAAVEIKTS